MIQNIYLENMYLIFFLWTFLASFDFELDLKNCSYSLFF